MGMKFTASQQQVIDARGKNLLVSAAAGSGKTAVLVERIIRQIMDSNHPMDIDRLLIVTFTNAAAAQMRERIGTAIETELSVRPGDAHLRRQQTLLHNAKITTIHSFCLYVIRNYFHQIDLEPDFRVGEEGELRLLRQDVLRVLLDRYYQEGKEAFTGLSEALATGKNDEKLKETVLKLYEFAMSDPWPEEWLNGCVRPYQCAGEAFRKEPVYEELLSYLKIMASQWIQLMETCVEISGEADGPAMYEEFLLQELEMLKELTFCESYEDYERVISSLAFGRLPAARKFEGDAGKKQQVQLLRNEIKDSRKKLLEQFFFQPFPQMQQNLLENAPAIEMLVQVTVDFKRAYEEKKREQNILDYYDLEHFALKILVDPKTKMPSDAARELREQFEEIMVDEYQDSNYVQETILRSVARESNRFMVGDVKQSIYRFRMARPELFMEKYDTYPTEREGKNKRIDLHKNFRSRREVLDAVNGVFSCIMARDLGNVEYDQASALHQGMEFIEASDPNMFQTELLVGDFDAFDQEEEIQDIEGVMIGERILRLMEGQLVTDEQTKELRPLEYRDIVILLRGVSGYGNQLVETLKAYGIPALASTGTGYFSTVEVQTALNLLRLIDNPRQDIPMAAILQSHIGGLTVEDLAHIRIRFPKESFYQSVASYAKEGDQKALREKLRSLGQMLTDFRERSCDTPIHELLFQVLEETGYLDYVSALPGGNVRRANLEMLMERAVAYEKSSYRGLFSFIRYISQLEKYQVDYGEAEDASEDAVRIMTIHKSKGLEFPVVFVAGMGRQFNRQDIRSRMVLHPQYGIGLDLTDVAKRIRIPSLTRQVLARRIQMENTGEELRVLYVAMTRAKEKLILAGTLKKASEKLDGFIRQRMDENGHMGFLFRLKAGCYFDWVLPALLQDPAYQVQLVAPRDLALRQIKQEWKQEWGREMLLQLAKEQDSRSLESIEQRLSYRYPYEEERTLKPKLSVSELKHRAIDRLRQEEADTEYIFQEPEVIPYVPEFMRKRGQEPEENTAALRGTAMHRVLECFDFTREFATLREQIQAMRESGRLEERLAELLFVPGLECFFRSKLAGRMQRAAKMGKLYREKPFVMGKPMEEVAGTELKDGADGGAMVLVQGIMDAFFEEEGEWVLVDYKTDVVVTGKELADRYRAQMDLYQEALMRATGKRVREKILYSFKLQKEIEV